MKRKPLAVPTPTDFSGLLNADELRWHVEVMRFPIEDGFTHERIAQETGLTAAFVGMVLSGAREPSKAFLKAIGFERIMLYRPKKP